MPPPSMTGIRATTRPWSQRGLLMLKLLLLLFLGGQICSAVPRRPAPNAAAALSPTFGRELPARIPQGVEDAAFWGDKRYDASGPYMPDKGYRSHPPVLAGAAAAAAARKQLSSLHDNKQQHMPPVYSVHVSPHIFALVVDRTSIVALDLLYLLSLILHVSLTLREARPLVLSGPAMVLSLVSTCVNTAFSLSKLSSTPPDSISSTLIVCSFLILRLILVSSVTSYCFLLPRDRSDRETGVRNIDEYATDGHCHTDFARALLAIALFFAFLADAAKGLSQFLVMFSAILKAGLMFVHGALLWQYSETEQVPIVLATRRRGRYASLLVPPMLRRTPSIFLPIAFAFTTSSAINTLIYATALNKRAIESGLAASSYPERILVEVFVIGSILTLVGATLAHAGVWAPSKASSSSDEPVEPRISELALLFPALGAASSLGVRYIVEEVDEDDSDPLNPTGYSSDGCDWDEEGVDEVLRDGLGLPPYAKDDTTLAFTRQDDYPDQLVADLDYEFAPAYEEI